MKIAVKRCLVNDQGLKIRIDSLLTYLVGYLIEKVEDIPIYKEGYDGIKVGEGSIGFNLRLEQVEDDSLCEKIAIIFTNKIAVVEDGLIRRCSTKDKQAMIYVYLDKGIYTYGIKATLHDEDNILFENDKQFKELWERSQSNSISLEILL